MIRFSFMIREIINQTHTDAQATRIYFNRIKQKHFNIILDTSRDWSVLTASTSTKIKFKLSD